MLVELLSSQGTTSDLTVEVERLGNLFAGYPGFWKAWSKELAANPAMQDAALAIRFFAAALQGQPLTWASIIEHGLQALLHGAEAVTPLSPIRTETREVMPEHVSGAFALSAPVEAFQEPDLELADEEEPVEAPDAAPYAAGAEAEDQDEEESEEAFSLRTRSMAEVLAEQGDIAGALDIYKELITAATDEDKVSLEARATELSRRMAVGAPTQEQPADDEATAKDGNRLIGLLESLAERLEARAR